MLRQELNQLKTDPQSLRRFGLWVGAVFLLLGLWFLARHKTHFLWCLVPGVLLIAFGLVFPKGLRPVYIPWMAMAFLLGFVVSTFLLTLFFYLVLTPIGLIAQWLGKDFLGLKWDSQTPTYWRPRRSALKQRSDYERQF